MMEIFCVNSVKGGSGKTTFSLAVLYNRALSYNSALEAKGIKTEDRKRFAYVDLDLQGTGVSRLIYGEEERDFVKFYNDRERKGESGEDFCYIDFCNSFPVYAQASVVIDAYLLNDSDDAKTFYGVKDKEILESRNVNRFKGRTKKLMEQILDSGKYDTVVFDCAPSYDYIASDFFEFICRKYNSSANRIVNAFVTTLEKSHVYTTISKVSNILKKLEYNLGIYVICNDVTGYFNVYKRDGQSFEETQKKTLEQAEKQNKFIEKVHQEIVKEKTRFRTKESPTVFSKDRIVVLEKLDISDTFVFSENTTLNLRDVLENFQSERLTDDLKLRLEE